MNTFINKAPVPTEHRERLPVSWLLPAFPQCYKEGYSSKRTDPSERFS